MSVPSEKLVAWVAKQLRTVTSSGGIQSFELAHSNEGGTGVETLQRFGGEASGAPLAIDADPEEVAQEIWDVAESDAETRMVGTAQRYVVFAFARDDDTEGNATAQVSFLVGSLRRGMARGFDSEPANEKGLLASLMRHNERKEEQLTQLTDAVMGKMLADNKELAARVKRAEDSARSVFELQQTLLDRSLERELKQAEAVQAARRSDELTSFFTSMVPLVAAKLLGTGALPGAKKLGNGARDHSVGKLLSSLTQEEVVGMLDALPPEKQMAVMELYKSYADDLTKAEAEKPAILQNPDIARTDDAATNDTAPEPLTVDSDVLREAEEPPTPEPSASKKTARKPAKKLAKKAAKKSTSKRK